MEFGLVNEYVSILAILPVYYYLAWSACDLVSDGVAI
uniref:Uncharacterized protein n=1 Tax=Rhizophora mucronata TaxID=61149 RepID=A0A2P2N306_RHIMU